MKNALECAGKRLRDGYLLVAKFVEGKYGVVEIHLYEELIFEELEETKLGFYTSGQASLIACQEPPDYTELDRNRQPYDRVNSTTYLPFNFEHLDIIPTSNGSRFLYLKKVRAFDISDEIDPTDTRKENICIVLNNIYDLAEYLTDFLPRLGVPSSDLVTVRNAIINQFVTFEIN